MFKPVLLRANLLLLKGAPRERAIEDEEGISLSWGALGEGARQSAYRAELSVGGEIIYSTGWVASEEQACRVPPRACPRAARVDWTLSLRDDAGRESAPAREAFYVGSVDWTAKWICADKSKPGETQYLRREFTLNKPVRRATLYACGLGYHAMFVNGARADDCRLDPAHTDYTKTCAYVMWPEVQGLLREGGNCLGAMIGGGWRDNPGPYVKDPASVRFFGPRQLAAMLDIEYEDGERERIETDEAWQAGGGANARNSLFDGEEYDANRTQAGWDAFGFRGFAPARVVLGDMGALRLMSVPPVREMGAYRPLTVSRRAGRVSVVDFGYNLSGVVRLRLKGLQKGQRIQISHAEELDESGDIYTAPLRGAKATDTYIASGDARDLAVWQPEFTYHGFRYARVEGCEFEESDIEAVHLHTDLQNASFFRSGSDALNALQRQIVLTERDNMHSILTDCPQRDERMGWMNDATVRFEETPYNFDCAPMFRKIVRDLLDVQTRDGAISCTAPKVFGAWPADPVCSSFLVAGWQSYMHFGDIDTLREGYPGFCAWENYLLGRSDGFIVNYSYYGDWAGPAYACEGEDGAVSKVTPGAFMSTGYSYYNCALLSRMARALGLAEDARKYEALAESVAGAMRDKWYDEENAAFATGSMACQAFSLWLGIVPEADRARAAKRMRDELARANYAFTTGNLCTRYLLDMLAEYGYADDAYALLTRDEYPSWGFMRQQEATTVWERFELKKNPGMNSHNHPMYGAAGAFLYAYIAGVVPTQPGYARFRVRPRMPGGLMSAQARVDTPRGAIQVRWTKRYGGCHLQVDVPFGCICDVDFMGETRSWASGAHALTVKTED